MSKDKIKGNRNLRYLLVTSIFVWVMFTILNTATLVSLKYPHSFATTITSAAVGTASVTISAGSTTITIETPENNTVYNPNDKFNLTAIITAANGNTADCNATILISDPSRLNLTSDTTQTIGNLINGK